MDLAITITVICITSILTDIVLMAHSREIRREIRELGYRLDKKRRD
ncbi:MAG: hypothetical protein ACERKV_02990 [Clostridiaceae bacterium]